MVDKIKKRSQTDVLGGLKLFILLSVMTTVFFYLYMLVSLRYATFFGRQLHSPFFDIR